MVINHNMSALNAQRNMGINNGAATKAMEKLSSGLKINRAGDNAAGLSISEKMRGQIRGLNQASTNAEDGISLIQTAEGALNETHSILQRMRELANQSSNDTNADVDRDAIQEEMNQLTSEVNRIANTTEFNTQKLLNGDKAQAVKLEKKSTESTVTSTVTVDTPGVAASGVGKANVDEISGELKAGTVKIDGKDLNITGDSQDKLYKSLKSAIEAHEDLKGKYAVADYTDGANKLTLTQKDGHFSNTGATANLTSAVTTNLTVTNKEEGVDSTSASKDEISGELKAGTVKIDGKDLDITGDSQDELYKSLKSAIEAHGELKDKYAVADYTDGANKLTLTQKSGHFSATGVDSTATVTVNETVDLNVTNKTHGEEAEASPIAGKAGKYTFEGTLEDGDKVTIDGKTLSVSGANNDELYKSLKAAIEADTELSAKYTVDTYNSGDNKLKITQNAEHESSTALKATVKRDTAAEYSFKFDKYAESVKIGDKEIPKDEKIFKDAKELADAITEAFKDDADGYKAVASEDGKTITLIEKGTQLGSEEGPKVTGAKDSAISLQIGANEGQSLSIEIDDMSASALGLTTDKAGDPDFTSKTAVTNGTDSNKIEYALDVTDGTSAKKAISTISDAIKKVSKQRSSLGAYQNRLEHTINNLGTSSENLTSAESRIRDTDMASEMSEYSKNNILQQAAQAMLAQAKSAPQSVLQLLQ